MESQQTQPNLYRPDTRRPGVTERHGVSVKDELDPAAGDLVLDTIDEDWLFLTKAHGFESGTVNSV